MLTIIYASRKLLFYDEDQTPEECQFRKEKTSLAPSSHSRSNGQWGRFKCLADKIKFAFIRENKFHTSPQMEEVEGDIWWIIHKASATIYYLL